VAQEDPETRHPAYPDVHLFAQKKPCKRYKSRRPPALVTRSFFTFVKCMEFKSRVWFYGLGWVVTVPVGRYKIWGGGGGRGGRGGGGGGGGYIITNSAGGFAPPARAHPRGLRRERKTSKKKDNQQKKKIPSSHRRVHDNCRFFSFFFDRRRPACVPRKHVVLSIV